MIITISGPSGTGKTTIANKIIEVTKIKQTVSCTTRTKREGEVNGVDYHFISNKEFEDRIKKYEFIEFALVHGNLYGTLIKELNHENVIVVLDVEGVKKIKDNVKHDKIISFYIIAPDIDTIRVRLGNRYKNINNKEYLNRLKNIQEELRSGLLNNNIFDFQVTNGDIYETTNSMVKIINKNMNSKDIIV